jgi:hypothetical protein
MPARPIKLSSEGVMADVHLGVTVPKKSVFDPNHGSNGRCPFIGGRADSAAACTGFILGESLFAQMKTRTVMQQPFA